MAWVSPKVYAILNNSEEGKDIIERLPELSQDECDDLVDEFFGNSGKGSSSNADYMKAKEDEEFERNVYEHLDDNDEDYERSWGPKDEMADGDLEEEIGMDRDLDGLSKEEKIKKVVEDYDVSKEQAKRVIEKMDAQGEKIKKAMGFGNENEEDLPWWDKPDEDEVKQAYGEKYSKKKLLEMKKNKFYSSIYDKVFADNDDIFTDKDKMFIMKMYDNNDTPEKFVNEIQNTDYYKNMKQKAEKISFINPEDDALISKASQEFYNQITKGKNGDNFKKKQIVIITGLPGAGKSSEEIKPFLENSIELDNDIAKGVPSFAKSYQNGLGAGKVHKASKKAERMVMQQLIKNGYNVVIPMIGDDEDSIFRRAQPFIEAGYSTPLLIHKNISNDESRKRAFKRAIETGRFIDDDVIQEYGNSSNETHERLRKNKGVYKKDGKEYKFRIYEDETR